MLPKLNQKVELTIMQGPFASAYATYVEDVAEREVTVVRPTVGGALLPLRVGEPAGIEYAENDRAHLSFTGEVAGFAERRLPVVIITTPAYATFRRSQRREHVRVGVNVPCWYTIRYAPSGIGWPGEQVQTLTCDLSGNGLQFLSSVHHPEGTLMELALDLNGKVVTAQAVVVREVQVLDSGHRWVGMAFTRIEERARDAIIRFSFKVQRDRNKRGLP